MLNSAPQFDVAYQYLIDVLATADNLYVYLLVDNAALDGVWLKNRPEEAAPAFGPTIKALQSTSLQWHSLMGDVTQPAHAAAVPLLIQLDQRPRTQHLIADLLKQGLHEHAVQCLTTPASMSALLPRLQQRTRLQFGTQEMVLRYFDNRAFHELAEVLTDVQWTAFLSVASTWHYANRDGCFTAVASNYAVRDTHAFPLPTDAKQREHLRKLGLTDRVHSELENLTQEPLMPDALPSVRHKWLTQRMHDAEQLGVTDPQYLIAYCHLALNEGDTFHQLPQWQATLASLKNKAVITSS
jgi:Domain of unknown function (DUF4123)